MQMFSISFVHVQIQEVSPFTFEFKKIFHLNLYHFFEPKSAILQYSVYSLQALHTLVRNRLDREQKNDWIKAFGYRGQGSTKLRARDIDGIFEKGAPLLSEVPSPNSIDFLQDVVDVVNKAIVSEGGLVNYPSHIQPKEVHIVE